MINPAIIKEYLGLNGEYGSLVINITFLVAIILIFKVAVECICSRFFRKNVDPKHLVNTLLENKKLYPFVAVGLLLRVLAFF